MTRSTPRRRALAAVAVLTATLALSACGEDTETPAGAADTDPAVTVTDPWVRATEGAADTTMTAAFMELRNTGTEDLTLVGASAEVAGTVEMHEMVALDGKNLMQEAEGGIELAAGGGRLLQPGGYHVMLMDLTAGLAPGDEVDLVLELSDGSSVELTAPVKSFTEEEGDYHDHGSHEHP